MNSSMNLHKLNMYAALQEPPLHAYFKNHCFRKNPDMAVSFATVPPFTHRPHPAAGLRPPQSDRLAVCPHMHPEQ